MYADISDDNGPEVMKKKKVIFLLNNVKFKHPTSKNIFFNKKSGAPMLLACKLEGCCMYWFELLDIIK